MLRHQKRNWKEKLCNKLKKNTKNLRTGQKSIKKWK